MPIVVQRVQTFGIHRQLSISRHPSTPVIQLLTHQSTALQYYDISYLCRQRNKILECNKSGHGVLSVTKKQLFSLRDTAMQLRSQRPLHVQGDAGHPG
jgi:hypothetical protein